MWHLQKIVKMNEEKKEEKEETPKRAKDESLQKILQDLAKMRSMLLKFEEELQKKYNENQ